MVFILSLTKVSAASMRPTVTCDTRFLTSTNSLWGLGERTEHQQAQTGLWPQTGLSLTACVILCNSLHLYGLSVSSSINGKIDPCKVLHLKMVSLFCSKHFNSCPSCWGKNKVLTMSKTQYLWHHFFHSPPLLQPHLPKHSANILSMFPLPPTLSSLCLEHSFLRCHLFRSLFK